MHWAKSLDCNPPFLARHWQQMIKEVKARADAKPE
jgi:hypothetical protein